MMDYNDRRLNEFYVYYSQRSCAGNTFYHLPQRKTTIESNEIEMSLDNRSLNFKMILHSHIVCESILCALSTHSLSMAAAK